MSYRIRIIYTDGVISVIDVAFSQLCQLFAGVSRPEFKRFMRREGGDVTLINGCRIWLVA
jgi:hypothetical protein